MTRLSPRGVGVLLIGLTTLFAARLLGTWELYFLGLSLLAVDAVAWLVVHRAAPGLVADRSLTPERPLAGDELVASLAVSNSSRLAGALEVTLTHLAGNLAGAHDGHDGRDRSERCDGQALEVDVGGLTAGVTLRLEVGVGIARRGLHRLPAMQATAGDPLGLVRSVRAVGEPAIVVVPPRLVRLSSCVLVSDLGKREQRRQRGLPVLGGTEFRSVRPHNPGEPLSHIDWKATARTGTLMLREMDDPGSGALTVFLDGAAARVVGQPPDTNFELAVRAAGSVADLALRSGRPVTLLTLASGWRQTSLPAGAAGRRQLREILARVEPQPAIHLGASLRTLLGRGAPALRGHALLLVVLALDRDLVHTLLALRRERLEVAVAYVAPQAFLPHHLGPDRSAAAWGTADPHAPSTDEERASLLSLTVAGIRCATLYRDDDLASVLAARPATRRTSSASAAVSFQTYAGVGSATSASASSGARDAP